MNAINRCLVGGMDDLDTWPNCATPDCEYKCCTWSGTVYCAIHAQESIGPDELTRRYNATHERPWDFPVAPGTVARS